MKLKFWQKEEDNSWNEPLSSEDPFAQPDSRISEKLNSLSNPQGEYQEPAQSYPQYPGHTPFPGSAAPPVQQPQASREIELILAKLDTIQKELDSMHQRLRKIEQATEPKQQRYW